MLPRHDKQRDLFETDQRTQAIPSSLRREIIQLIGGLLIEAICGVETQSEDRATREDAHEQDHA